MRERITRRSARCSERETHEGPATEACERHTHSWIRARVGLDTATGGERAPAPRVGHLVGSGDGCGQQPARPLLDPPDKHTERDQWQYPGTGRPGRLERG